MGSTQLAFISIVVRKQNSLMIDVFYSVKKGLQFYDERQGVGKNIAYVTSVFFHFKAVTTFQD